TVQAQQHGRQLSGAGNVPEVVTGELVVGELLLPATFPEEIQGHVHGRLLRPFHEAGERFVEPEQDVGRLHLAAFAVRRLDLQRRVVVGQDDTYPETAFFFVQNVHAGPARSARKTMSEYSAIWAAVEGSISGAAEVSAAL